MYKPRHYPADISGRLDDWIVPLPIGASYSLQLTCLAFATLAITRHQKSGVASPSIPSWNQIVSFLESLRQLRESSGFVA
jgi:hypothetical protein